MYCDLVSNLSWWELFSAFEERKRAQITAKDWIFHTNDVAPWRDEFFKLNGILLSLSIIISLS